MTNFILFVLLARLLVPNPLTYMPESEVISLDLVSELLASSEPKVSQVQLSSREMSMDYRYPVASVSEVFKDNILLNIAYLDGRVSSASQINWDQVNQSNRYEFTLNPNEVFAYHDGVLPKYKDKVVITTKSQFNKQDGYKTDGYLYGDGVCQLASLINWAAKDANLEVYAPANHDFAAIPEVPKEHGVAIYFDPNNPSHSANRNLYITNNQDKPITFVFDYDGKMLKISVVKVA